MIKVIAKISIKDGEVENFFKIAEKLIDGSRQEVANESYELVRDVENTNNFYFIETWISKNGLQNHSTQPHFLEAVASLQKVASAPLEIINTKVIL